MNEPSRYGAAALARFLLASMISLLNPRLLAQQVLQAGGQLVGVLAAATGLRRRSPAGVVLHLPVEGRWRIHRGGVTPRTSHSWTLVSQRYALDLVALDETGRTHRAPGRLADHASFGRPVRAPLAGEVVSVRDGARDLAAAGTGWIDPLTPDLRGNHVVLRTDDGVHVLLAHLRRGSVRVRPGERVARGDLLGACGNSGHSTEPHLHLHAQDGPGLASAIGLPVVFADASVERDGGRAPLGTPPRTGDIVYGEGPETLEGAEPAAPRPPERAAIGPLDLLVSLLYAGAMLALLEGLVGRLSSLFQRLADLARA